VTHHDRVSTRWHRFKEVASNHGTAIGRDGTWQAPSFRGIDTPSSGSVSVELADVPAS
jgi:hypothetical protein